METVDLGTVILVVLVLLGGWVLGNVLRTAAEKRGMTATMAAGVPRKTRTAKTAPRRKAAPARRKAKASGARTKRAKSARSKSRSRK